MVLVWSDPLREELTFLERALAVRAGVAEALQVKVLLAAASLLTQLYEAERAGALAEEALALARQAGDTRSTANALLTIGWAAAQRDQLAVARAYYEEAVGLLQQMDNARERRSYFIYLSEVVNCQGEYERARVMLEECLAYYTELGDKPSTGSALLFLGWNPFVSQGDPTRGVSLAEQGLAIPRELGDQWMFIIALLTLGVMRRHQGRFDEAGTLLEEHLARTQGQWAVSDIMNVQTELARLRHQQGRLAEAQALYQQNRALLPLPGGRIYITSYLEGWAALHAELGLPVAAARLWGAAEALREALGAPMYPVNRAEYAPLIAAARAELGEAAFDTAWAEGRQLTPEAALALVG